MDPENSPSMGLAFRVQPDLNPNSSSLQVDAITIDVTREGRDGINLPFATRNATATPIIQERYSTSAQALMRG